VTIGPKAAEKAQQLFESDSYQDYLYFHGFAVEAAEALAEYWHKEIRRELRLDADDGPDIPSLFRQQYQGSRYSFGYPACPDLEDQAHLFTLLQPERIAVTLTEEWQLVPEQSTSAIIVHHPDAKYFSV
jgi:5-methyltetrahydrofolate--homocysteine methyltransferase